MNVLAIGNSFSQDAMRYLHGIAKANGDKLEAVNLYIGGCPLEKHYRNMLGDYRAYTLQYNGTSTGFPVSIKEALLNRSWDVVTLQQASHFSYRYETYQPYLNELVAYVRKYAPHARVMIHQTWAYEDGGEKLAQRPDVENASEMLEKLKKAYAQAAEDTRADGLIPSGELMYSLLEHGIPRVHRDGFHASLGLGRYALGLLWYRALTGKDIMDNSFSDFDEEISAEDILTVKQCVSELGLITP